MRMRGGRANNQPREARTSPFRSRCRSWRTRVDTTKKIYVGLSGGTSVAIELAVIFKAGSLPAVVADETDPYEQCEAQPV